MHDGYLWLDKPVFSTKELIQRITCLPVKGEDLGPIIRDKNISNKVTKEYEIERGSRGYLISMVNNQVTIFFTQGITCKLLQNFR